MGSKVIPLYQVLALLIIDPIIKEAGLKIKVV